MTPPRLGHGHRRRGGSKSRIPSEPAKKIATAAKKHRHTTHPKHAEPKAGMPRGSGQTAPCLGQGASTAFTPETACSRTVGWSTMSTSKPLLRRNGISGAGRHLPHSFQQAESISAAIVIRQPVHMNNGPAFVNQSADVIRTQRRAIAGVAPRFLQRRQAHVDLTLGISGKGVSQTQREHIIESNFSVPTVKEPMPALHATTTCEGSLLNERRQTVNEVFS